MHALDTNAGVFGVAEVAVAPVDGGADACEGMADETKEEK
jgi:hypothetical protein